MPSAKSELPSSVSIDPHATLYSSGSTRLPEPSKAACRWLTIGVIVLLATVLRGWGLGGAYEHFDERISVAMSQHLERTQGWNNNWRVAQIPNFSSVDQYNFSAYLYSTHLFRRLIQQMNGNDWLRARDGLYAHRLFAALCGIITVWIVVFTAWRWKGATLGVAVGLLMALNPQLIQDAHYARPETFMTLGFAILLALGLLYGPSAWKAAGMAGIAGLLAATKANHAALIIMPAYVVWQLGESGSTPRERTILCLRGSCALGASFLLGWFVGVPHAITHWPEYLSGLAELAAQYRGSHPPYSLPDHGAIWPLMRSYYSTTLGGPWLLLMVTGITWLLFQRRLKTVVLLVAPVVCSVAIFGWQGVFFERNLSPVAPAAVIMVGLGTIFLAGALLKTPKFRFGFVVAVVLATSVTAGRTLQLFLGEGIEGDAVRMQAYRQSLNERYPDIHHTVASLYDRREVAWIEDEMAVGKGRILLSVHGFNDAYLERWLPVLAERYQMLPVGEFRGTFADYPPSAFKVFHGARMQSYLLYPR